MTMPLYKMTHPLVFAATAWGRGVVTLSILPRPRGKLGVSTPYPRNPMFSHSRRGQAGREREGRTDMIYIVHAVALVGLVEAGRAAAQRARATSWPRGSCGRPARSGM